MLLSCSTLQTASTQPPVTASCCDAPGIHPPLSGHRVVMTTTVEHFIQRGNKEKYEMGRAREKKYLTVQHDRHHTASFTASVETLTFLNFPPLSPWLCFLSHESPLKFFLWLQYFNSICYIRKPKWSLSFVLVDGGPSVGASWLLIDRREKKKSLLECDFLNLRCIFDRWYSWLPWLTLEN